MKSDMDLSLLNLSEVLLRDCIVSSTQGSFLIDLASFAVKDTSAKTFTRTKQETLDCCRKMVWGVA
jgi:hypothetical protein